MRNCFAGLLHIRITTGFWLKWQDLALFLDYPSVKRILKGAFDWGQKAREENGMKSDTKKKRPFFITIVSVFFSLCVFVSNIPVYAVGEIMAWGDNEYGQCTVPEPNIGFTAISAGECHSLGLKQDGSIVAWGWNVVGQCTVPEPNTGFTAISAGGYHSLGLKQDGSIVAWGDNDNGQCNVPEPNTGFTAISAGGYHSLGLKQDGSIVAWGWNSYGECNVPEPNTGFMAIAAGFFHSLGLKGCSFNLAGDLYSDCVVNLEDLTILIDQWLQLPGTPSADIAPLPNGDGIVNFFDFAIMVGNWLVDCYADPNNSACVHK
jgi:hypothetical protein